MAKKINNLEDIFKETPVLWFGRTENKNDELILIWNNNGISHIVLAEEVHDDEEGDKLILHATSDTLKLKKEILESILICFPQLKEYDDKVYMPTKSFKKVKVSHDFNQFLYDKDIKFLDKALVTQVLTNAGIDISSYEYTDIKVDNTHKLVATYCAHGYENYTPEVRRIMVDVSKYKDYIMDKTEEYDMLDKGCYIGIVAAGPAGTGKSTDPLIYAAKHGIPIIVFQCTPNTEEDTIIGNFIPDGKGGFILKRGPLANAIEQDCWIVINEANYVPSAILSILNSIMDDNAQVLLDDGTMLHRHANFRIILTVNPGYRGTNLFNEATLNRFVTIYYPPITKEVLVERLMFETGYKNKKVLDCIADQFNTLRNLYKDKNMDTEVTYRNVHRFLKMRLLSPEVSIEKQFDMAFITNAIFEFDDIDIELADLQKVRKEYVEKIKAAEEASTVSAIPNGSLHIDLPQSFDEEIDSLDLDLDSTIQSIDEEEE